MGDILIGIDPEPSGAWSIWNTLKDPQPVKFFTSFPDIKERADNFWHQTESYAINRVHVYIEDSWIRPGMAAQSMTKYVKSYGAWLGILYTRGFSKKQVSIIPAAVWKKRLGLTNDKVESEVMVRGLFKDPKGNFDYDNLMGIKLAPDCPVKQVYDRCESFLIAYYGKTFL